MPLFFLSILFFLDPVVLTAVVLNSFVVFYLLTRLSCRFNEVVCVGVPVAFEISGSCQFQISLSFVLNLLLFETFAIVVSS